MSKFYVWIDVPNNTNVLSPAVLVEDDQKINGFQAGQAASAARVNTMLRQSSLVTCALVNALGISDEYDVSSSLDDLTQWFIDTNMFKLSNKLVVTENGDLEIDSENLLPKTTRTTSIGSPQKRFDAVYGDLNGDLIGPRYSARMLCLDIQTTVLETKRLRGASSSWNAATIVKVCLTALLPCNFNTDEYLFSQTSPESVVEALNAYLSLGEYSELTMADFIPCQGELSISNSGIYHIIGACAYSSAVVGGRPFLAVLIASRGSTSSDSNTEMVLLSNDYTSVDQRSNFTGIRKYGYIGRTTFGG